AWSDTLGRFCKLNTSKNFEIMKEIIEKELSADDRREVYESFGELLRMVSEGKSSGYIPDGHFPNGRALLNDEDFRNSLDEDITDLQWWLVKETSARSIDRKSTRLNSSHVKTSYAVFCLKKKKTA